VKWLKLSWLLRALVLLRSYGVQFCEKSFTETDTDTSAEQVLFFFSHSAKSLSPSMRCDMNWALTLRYLYVHSYLTVQSYPVHRLILVTISDCA
jgi:hypothetical protein